MQAASHTPAHTGNIRARYLELKISWLERRATTLTLSHADQRLIEEWLIEMKAELAEIREKAA